MLFKVGKFGVIKREEGGEGKFEVSLSEVVKGVGEESLELVVMGLRVNKKGVV